MYANNPEPHAKTTDPSITPVNPDSKLMLLGLYFIL
jgi:hypothetical protein